MFYSFLESCLKFYFNLFAWSLYTSAPVAPPVHEWKKIMDDVNAKTQKLEEDYEQTCIQKKVKPGLL